MNFVDQVNPIPRPYQERVDVTTWTTIYFEVLVPDYNGDKGKIDPNSITATLIPDGGEPIPMLLPNQTFAPGFSGKVYLNIDSGDDNGHAVYIKPDNPLNPSRLYTVEVYAITYDGLPIDSSADSWSFTTRPVIADPTVSWNINLTGPMAPWKGWFFSGICKPSFDTSRMYDQYDSYNMMDTVNAINPNAWSLQRDWPFASDYWHNGIIDGNPNVVREKETRQIISLENQGKNTLLTVKDIEEGPLFGITPDRPLSEDFHPGDYVTVADRDEFEITQVVGVDDKNHIVKVNQLVNPVWDLDYRGSHPPDNPDTPDNFTLPLCYLRKYDPIGTPVYYWRRVDDEWDVVHGQHRKRLQVNFCFIPVDLASEPVPARSGGHGSISPPKEYLQWHDFVREVVFHLIDRYGEATKDFYYSIGNENNLNIFWSGTKDEYYEFYDYTVNAVLKAFEERGFDTSKIVVGGIEAANLLPIEWMTDALYHCSGAADKPGGGIAEQNFVCNDTRFDGKRAARVQAICDAHGGKGSPIDFASIHEYEHADLATSQITQVRDKALAMDPVFYEKLNIPSFECTPDWIPRTDPASRRMFKGNGYFPSWCAEWMQRLVERAESDHRYANHEATLTVWPYDYNGDGITSVTGLMRVDDNADGTEDRIVTIRKAIFNYIELLAHMSHDLDALPAQNLEGIRFAGVRSIAPDVQSILLYNHDKYDTESSEETDFTARLTLTGIIWPAVTVRRWRIDRDHSSPYHAYEALPKKSLYSPEEVAPLEEADDLVEDGPPQHFETASGTLNLSAPLRVNGVTHIEIRKWDDDNDGIYGPSDCDDSNPEVWAIPGEALDLRLTHSSETGITTLTWNPPSDPGATSVFYDTIRSTDPSDFSSDASCIESDGSDATSSDSDMPPDGKVFYYLIRAENECPDGQGSMGKDSSGNERTALPCP
ncbi:MAG: hypothetical protein AB1756_05030 [Acidobacteriota bacterium]